MELKKGQFAVFDLLLMLVFIFSTYFIFQQDISSMGLTQNTNYDGSQLLLFLSDQDNFNQLLFLENLSNSSVEENWTNISFLTGINENNLHFIIGNVTHQNIIFSCIAKNELVITRDFFIENSSLELRYVEFGVCR